MSEGRRRSPEPDPDLRKAGDRIDVLLERLEAAADPRLRATAQEAIQLIVTLYGGALARTVEVLQEAGATVALQAMASDDLIASLLLVHDLHPLPLRQRVEQALEDVRPYMDTHGGGVELVELTDDGVVRLRMLGSCDGCPSTSVTLELAVTGAIEAAAPEIASIELENTATPEPSASNLIPLESLGDRLQLRKQTAEPPQSGPRWVALTRESLPEGVGVVVVEVEGLAVALCRTPDRLLAFRDACGVCGAGLQDAALDGNRLVCPHCEAGFDVATGGQGKDGANLSPLPVLERDGNLEIALPVATAAS